MVVLVAFGLIAGAATALSPCVLPVLPIALSAGVTGGRRRPLGIVTGLAASFAFATVALVYVISALGLPNGLLRTLAIVVLIGFGATLALPPLSARVEAWLSRLTGGSRRARDASGFGSGVVVGAGLGLVYAPCAGPILAGVITASASERFSAGRLAVAIAYALGSAVTLYALMLGGRRLAARLVRHSSRFQVATGAVMIAVGAALLGGYDTRFESSIASGLPSFLVDPTRSLERTHAAQHALADLRGARRAEAGLAEARRSAPLPDLGRAPEFVGVDRWFNSAPLTLAGLRGRVVLVDFWTYSCVNCIRTLPYLEAWDAKYRSRGLTIVGVHAPEFPFEHSASNVAAAIGQDGIRYPVAQDNELATWDAYGNQYWPAEYLIDATGEVRLVHFGEGDYAAKERAIRALLVEAGASELGGTTRPRAQQPSQEDITPESYLGAARAERFAGGPVVAGRHDYGSPTARLGLSQLAYGGVWNVGDTSAVAGSGASIALRFRARRVFLVLGSPDRPRTVRVLLDGRPIASAASGADVTGARLTVGFERLYRLVDLPRVENRTLTLRFSPGVAGYAFTFG